MEELPLAETAPRDIVIANAQFAHANIEAWSNIIASYRERHPEHEVIILYEGTELQSMISLFKLVGQPNLQGFQLVVRAADGDWRHVAKLYRLLVEGAGPNYTTFLKQEMYRVLKLF